MKHHSHFKFIDAIGKLSSARQAFTQLAADKLILGNDNHIGDIGEYWIRRYYELLDQFDCYGPGKTAPYDIKLKDGTHVSVKTVTTWSKTGYGTPVEPLDGKDWTVLAGVRLGDNLFPTDIAIVTLRDLMQQHEFLENAKRRTDSDPERRTAAFPRFKWWSWLDDHTRKFSIKDSDLVLGDAQISETKGVTGI